MPDDIRASLEEAFAAKSTGKPLDDVAEKEIRSDVDDETSSVDAQPKDTGKDPVDKPADKAVADKTVDADKTAADDPKKTDAKPHIAAPVKWTKEEKEAWDKMTEGLEPAEAERINKIKSILLGRNRSMEGEFTRQMQAIAQTRKSYDEINAILEPVRADWKKAGISDAAGIQELIKGFDYSNRDPVGFIRWIAELRGVDLTKAFGGSARQPAATEGDDLPALHPAIQKQLDDMRAENQRLNQQVSQFGQSVQQRAQQEQQALQTNVQREIQSFAEAVDEAGQPKHPLFNEVRGDMQHLINSGRANSLADAYDMAVYANPVTRQKLLESQALQQRREWEERQRQEAARAKKAGGGITTSAPSVTRAAVEEPPASGSVADDLHAALAARLSRGARI